LKLGIFGNHTKQQIVRMIKEHLEWIRNKGIEFYIEKELAEKMGVHIALENSIDCEDLAKKCEIVLVFGGDGTMLLAARKIGIFGVPILGINSGGLGFLTEVTPEELIENMERLLKKDYEIDNRILLEARKFGDDDRVLYALNDFVIDKGFYGRTLTIKVVIEGTYYNKYTSNGIIVSTATGSTAYSLSAGGPVLYPTLKDILITPICSHELAVRPLIVPGEYIIEIQVQLENYSISMYADGQAGFLLKNNQRVEIKRSEYSVNLVHFRERSFYQVLRKKLS